MQLLVKDLCYFSIFVDVFLMNWTAVFFVNSLFIFYVYVSLFLNGGIFPTYYIIDSGVFWM